MIASNENGLVFFVAINQQIERTLRIRSAINVVPEKNVDYALGTMLCDIVVDDRKSSFEQICATMDVADCIDTYPGRSACPFLSFSHPSLKHFSPL